MGKSVQVYFSQSLSYGTLAKPATHIINRKGDVVGKVMGPRNRHSAEAREFFRQLLAKKT